MSWLAPAKVHELSIRPDTGIAEVIVPDFQLSLAIGKEGQDPGSPRVSPVGVSISRARGSSARKKRAAGSRGRMGREPVGELMRQPAEGGETISAAEAGYGSLDPRRHLRVPGPRRRREARSPRCPSSLRRRGGDGDADAGQRAASRRAVRAGRRRRRGSTSPRKAEEEGELRHRRGTCAARPPERRCVGCGRSAPPARLDRVAVGEGRQLGAAGGSPGAGPGARARACFDQAVRRECAGRALRTPCTNAGCRRLRATLFDDRRRPV